MRNILYILLLFIAISNAETIDLGRVDCNKTAKEYPNFFDSFKKAYIGIPKGVLGRAEPFYGTYQEALIKIPNLKKYTKKLPTVVYMQGSGNFESGELFRKWITQAGYIFFAPNTYTSPKRPRYHSPVPKDIYEKVHAYRQAEIDLFIKSLSQLPFVDKKRMFLMGFSEGALASARYSGDEFVGRIILGWGCEANYYTDYPKIGAKKSDPILNIIGRDDKYFGKQNPWSRAYHNEGNCADGLFDFDNAKVVILPNTGHKIANNPFVKDEILNFLKMFKNYRVNQEKEKKKAQIQKSSTK
jgi:dienelactone hydrolase